MRKQGATPAITPGPLFIVSMWRGGSSLLHVLLNKHPQVALMYEADLLLLRPVFIKPPCFSDWRDRWELWNQVFTRHELSPSEFKSGCGDFKTAFEKVHRSYARQKGAVIWGDKSPNYHDQLLAMVKIFPSARFIIVWRDPIDTIGATRRAAAAGSRYFRKYGTIWRSLFGYRVFKRQCRQLVASGVPVHQLHYEDLVSDTAKVMRQVCAFLDIPYDDSLCTLEGADRSAVYAESHHNLLRENAIVRGARPDLIDPARREKIELYLALWRKADEGEEAGYGRSVFGFVQQQFDRLRYRLYRCLDALIRLGFCYLPICLLGAYRRRKKQMQANQLSSGSLKLSSTEPN